MSIIEMFDFIVRVDDLFLKKRRFYFCNNDLYMRNSK